MFWEGEGQGKIKKNKRITKLKISQIVNRNEG